MSKFEVRPPFFEIGPKAYLYGEASLKLAKEADRLAGLYDVQVIYTPQYADIFNIARHVSNLCVFAQHADCIPVGRGIGSVLMESLKEAGAQGVMLNHCEKRLTVSELQMSIKRANEVGLCTIVCADDTAQAKAIAHFAPDVILIESPERVGVKGEDDGDFYGADYIKEIGDEIRAINPDIQLMHSAGIYTGEDVRKLILLGADGTGCTSGIIRAEDPFAAMDDMLKALRAAWDERTKK